MLPHCFGPVDLAEALIAVQDNALNGTTSMARCGANKIIFAKQLHVLQIPLSL